jgi:hypothetical protein
MTPADFPGEIDTGHAGHHHVNEYRRALADVEHFRLKVLSPGESEKLAVNLAARATVSEIESI